MSADSEPSIPDPNSWGSDEDQDEVLARELAAFPAEDEPIWEELEYLEYLDDDAGPGDDEPCPVGLPGPVPGEYRTTPGTTAATTAAGGSSPAGAGFGHGGAADAMPPGAVLAGLADRVWQQGLDGLDDDELTGILQAAQRLGAWAAALELSAVSDLAARRKAQALAGGDWRGLEHAEDEIAVALTLTRFSASRVLALALGLDRLPLTRAALAAGRIDERRAAVIADELAGLDDEPAAAVEALIIAGAAGQTTGELRPAARRAVIAADPAAAKRRKEQALKDARVEASSAPSGTAALAGRDLPPAGVLAADKHLSALAQEMKKAGAEGTMDQLRAFAYLHLLSGQPAGTLLTRPAPTGPGATTSHSPATPGTGIPDGGSGSTPGHGFTGTGTTGTKTTGAGAPGARGTGTAGTGTPGAGTAGARNAGTGPAGTGPAGMGAPGPGRPALRGTVNLTMPLATWLGWSQSPGQVPGFGTLDAGDSRTLAAMLAGDPASKWCITLTDRTGRPIAHGCARNGPRPPSQPPPGPGAWYGPWPRPRSGPGSGGDPGTGPRAGPGPGPAGDPGWIAAVRITPLQAGHCSHPRETPAYQPGPVLRHIIQVRQATCCYPGCRRPATACDLDHTIAHHLGGRTCECGLSPLCRAHHQAKQAPGWALAQNQPGTMTWTTPAGRTYTTEPTCYPA